MAESLVNLVTCDDETLWNVIDKFNVATVKELLAKANIPTTANKPNLQWRLYYAIRHSKCKDFTKLYLVYVCVCSYNSTVKVASA